MEFVTLYRIGDKLGWSVYIHISPSNKYYVGITSKTPEERWRNGFGYYTQSYFYNAIQKYGWDNFQHEIISENLSNCLAVGGNEVIAISVFTCNEAQDFIVLLFQKSNFSTSEVLTDCV